MKNVVVALALVVVSSGCRTSGPTVSAPAVAPQRPAVPDSIKWTRASAEHDAMFLQVYRLAAAHVDAAARTHATGTWAVVLDADETVIDNSLYQEERAVAGLGYSDASWDAWVKRREATPLPGAAAFLSHVRTSGGRIAIVTNRLASQCADTEAVFAK
jgi:5'-nucleotidase (lipoprotein e(P4) family)